MIALDARMIGHSGIGTYIRGLLSGFTAKELREIVLLGDPEKLGAFPCRVLTAMQPIYGLGEQVKMPRLLRTLSPDVLHVPHYNIPVGYCGRTVVTIHDLIHLLYPQFSRTFLARFYARWMLSLASKKAARILADSECTRRDLLAFGALERKITVVPLGVDGRFKPIGKAEAEACVGKYGLIPGYILYLGNIRKIKNIPRLVDAYRLLRKRCPDVPPLVLAGRDQIPRVTLAFRGDNSIHLVGEVALADMPSLYSCASLFAFPSLYEGFGLPPLEAMACRCPVVASTGGSLPEILGDAALLPDPGDMEAIADAITRVLLDADLRRTLVERGSARVRHFSWERAAKATFEIYREVAARS